MIRDWKIFRGHACAYESEHLEHNVASSRDPHLAISMPQHGDEDIFGPPSGASTPVAFLSSPHEDSKGKGETPTRLSSFCLISAQTERPDSET
jgi:hypothetical protein